MKEGTKRWLVMPSFKTIYFWLELVLGLIFLIPFPSIPMFWNILMAVFYGLAVCIQNLYYVYTSDAALTLFIGFSERRIEWKDIKEITFKKNTVTIYTITSKKTYMNLKRIVEKEAFLNFINEKTMRKYEPN